MNWLYTNIQHGPRIELGLSPNEYCVLDLYYQTQTNPAHSVGGWSENSYQQVSNFMGFSKGAVHKMVDRFVNAGLMEVNPANPKQKRTTSAWFSVAYERVQKVNDPQTAVQKVNDVVQKVNANRSKSERHIEEREYKIEFKGKGSSGFFDDAELLDLDAQSEALEKEKKVAPKKEKAPQGLTPKTAAAASAIIAELRGRYESGSPAPVDAELVSPPQDATDEVLRWLREDPAGKQHWQTIRQYAKAAPGELDDPEQTVLAAKCVLGEYVTSNFHQFKKRLHGFGLTQLNKDRRAATNSTNNAKPNRNGATRQPVISDEQALRVAKRALEQELSGAGESWY